MRVIIVGSGPTGAALSLLLARRGVDVVLLEREAAFDRVFRGEAMMPSGLDALRQMGLGRELDGLPQVVVPCMEMFIEGRRVQRADWPEVSGDNAGHVVSQPALIEMLVAAAARSGPFELRKATAFEDLEMAGDHVDVRAKTTAGSEVLRCDFVIAADGRASLVRARAGLKLERLELVELPSTVAWFSLPAPETQRRDPRFQMHLRQGRSVVLYPSWDGGLRVGVNLSPADNGTAADREHLLARIATVAGEPYATVVRERAAEIADPVLLKVLVGRSPAWVRDRLLLLGDAAHPMAPVRAQGINLALRDAIVAANHLVPALEQGTGEAFAAAGEAIQEERQPEIAAIQALQLQALHLPPPLRSPVLRATLLPALRRLGVAKRMLLASEMPFRHGVADVRLAV